MSFKGTDDSLQWICDKLEIDKRQIVIRDIQTMIKDDGLQQYVVQFTRFAKGLASGDFQIKNGIELVTQAKKIIDKLKTSHPATAAIFCIVTAGMTLFSQNIDTPSMDSVLKSLLQNQSDQDLERSCLGTQTALVHAASFLCGLGIIELNGHEISAMSANVPITIGAESMGKLAQRIGELLKLEYENYVHGNDDPSVLKKIVQYTDVFSCLATLRIGILYHLYALLKISKESNKLVNALENSIETQQNQIFDVLSFLTKPNRVSAIFHFRGHVRIIYADKYLTSSDMNMDTLEELCRDSRHLIPWQHSRKDKEAKMYMVDEPVIKKYIRWSKSGIATHNRFIFKREQTMKGNYFYIYSHSLTDYRLKVGRLGLWIEGSRSKPPVNRNSLWQIIPVEKDDCISKTRYYIGLKETSNKFLYADFTGRVCLQRFSEAEHENALWLIE